MMWCSTSRPHHAAWPRAHRARKTNTMLQITCCATPPQTASTAVSIRRATLADIPELATFSAQAAASVELQRFDAVRDTNESLQGVLSLLETRLADRWQEELTTQLAAALRAKQQCAAEAREYRLQRAAARLRAQLRALQGGGGGGFPAPLTPDERRQIAKWRRARQFQCLVAEQLGGPGGGGDTEAPRRLLGVVTLSLATPEAQLPPPLPTNSPLRVYVSNMAVAPECRRRGIASTLLQSCERVARCWGFDSIYLHVDAGNRAAESLYARAGYGVQGGATWWQGGSKRTLMTKPLTPWGGSSGGRSSGRGSSGRGSSGGDGSNGAGGAYEEEGDQGMVGVEGTEGVEGWVENGVFVWRTTSGIQEGGDGKGGNGGKDGATTQGVSGMQEHPDVIS